VLAAEKGVRVFSPITDVAAFAAGLRFEHRNWVTDLRLDLILATNSRGMKTFLPAAHEQSANLSLAHDSGL